MESSETSAAASPQDELAAVDGAYFAELSPTAITPNPRQPRTVFDEEAMAELVHSIREVGCCSRSWSGPSAPDRYELVMGERRWRAAQQAGLAAIPAIVRETEDDELLRDALLENLHRAQLNPLEEAAAYQQMLDDFGCTQEELASRIGRSRPQISNTLRLLQLSAPVQRRVAAGVLSAGHARALLGVEDPARQDALAARVVAEGISVRGLEEMVAVGDGAEPATRARRRATRSAPGLADIADRLDGPVRDPVQGRPGPAKGRITVEFASLDDLQRILALMDPANRLSDTSLCRQTGRSISAHGRRPAWTGRDRQDVRSRPSELLQEIFRNDTFDTCRSPDVASPLPLT